jgi:hypothetical protein
MGTHPIGSAIADPGRSSRSVEGSHLVTSDVFTMADWPRPPDRSALVARGRRLANRVLGFERRLGLNAYESTRAAEDLLAALLESRGRNRGTLAEKRG